MYCSYARTIIQLTYSRKYLLTYSLTYLLQVTYNFYTGLKQKSKMIFSDYLTATFMAAQSRPRVLALHGSPVDPQAAQFDGVAPTDP